MLEKIIAVIDARGLTQGELEQAAHLSENRISKWRNTSQRTHPRWEEVVSLARVLGVSLDWLASDAPDELPSPPTRDEELLARAIEKMGASAALDKILSPDRPANPEPPRALPGYVSQSVKQVSTRDEPRTIRNGKD